MEASEVQELFQREWDEAWDTFRQAHLDHCRHPEHKDPAVLIGNLDQCWDLDHDPMANFAYGTMLSLRFMAERLDIHIDCDAEGPVGSEVIRHPVQVH